MEAKKSIVEIISTTIIKPSSPTPHNKRHLKLSLFDQTFSAIYAPLILFYTTPSDVLIINFLQKSLSKTLVHFYPFAGQLKDNFTSIECNDQGAYLLEAQINSTLSDFLQNPDPKTIIEFLPSSDPKTLQKATTNNVITLVKLTAFSCGGIAIGLEVSHKIADGFSVSCFAKTWAAISAGKQDFAPPMFVGPDLLPPPKSPIKRITPTRQAPLRSRRFIFNATKLANLKAKIQQNGVINFNLSTLEAISSLLFKCVVAASGSGALIEMVNLRKRLTQPLPEKAIGNFAWAVIVSAGERNRLMELHEIAIIIRRGLSNFFRDCEEKKLKGEALFAMVSRFAEEEAELAKAGIGLYWCSGLSSLQLYEADFGWGKPEWVTAPFLFDKRFPMMHSKSGQDIEVWATLEEKVMAKFESNEELLAFASIDAPINATAHCRM